ncbi:MAG: ArnT family glycosyltransferase [Candidatus Obscuribacterales bacterium]
MLDLIKKDATVTGDESSGVKPSLSRRDYLAAGSSGLCLFLLTFLWFSLDHHVPMMDEAGHVLHGLYFRDLFEHASVLKGSWWHSMLTVSQFYPPVVPLVTGFLKATVVSSPFVDIFVHAAFTFVLTASMVLAGRLMGLTLRASVLAAVFVNLFPGVSSVNHQFMLDFPATAAVGAGVLAMLVWRARPGFVRAVAVGLLLGVCCMTKQIVAAFLLGTGIFLVIGALSGGQKEKRAGLLLQLGALVVSTVVVGLPWVITNASYSKSITDYMSTCFQESGTTFGFGHNLIFYIGCFVPSMTPLLVTLFVGSLIYMLVSARGRRIQVELLPVTAMAVAGVLLMSTYLCSLERYIMPALIYAAYCLGAGCDMLMSRRMLMSVVLLTLAGLQFVSYNFSPYPLNVPLLAELSSRMGVKTMAPTCKNGSKDNPVPASTDWGYAWVTGEIEKVDKDKPVYLNVLINEPELNAQSFELYFRERRLPIFGTTSRIWAVSGDVVEFSEEKALYYQWYLFKTANTPFGFKDRDSKEAFEKLTSFVKDSGPSGRFYLAGSRPTPDGAAIELYRQK